MAESTEDLESMLESLPPIIAADEVNQLVSRLLVARGCKPLVFYTRDEVIAALRASSGEK